MQHFHVLLGLGVVLALLVLLSLTRLLLTLGRPHYRVDDLLLTSRQRELLGLLERALGSEYRVFARIGAAEIIAVDRRLERRRRERAQRQLEQHTFDFLICASATSAIVCAVTLERGLPLIGRAGSGALVRLCAAARLPLARFRERERYSVSAVEARIREALGQVKRRAQVPPSLAEASWMPGGLDGMRAERTSPALDQRDLEPRLMTRSPTGELAPRALDARAEPRLGLDEDLLDLGSEPRMRIDGESMAEVSAQPSSHFQGRRDGPRQ
ncbi:MAG: DUF2726 domain-containing protein [Sphingobacteriia bacterium]|nr:DUF2726 domain-containing protein [Sphingobacteriia bacterium]NCC40297.1 DUF2726 domain-containing protein [Gammaproteobacteria bacterium]